MEAIAKASQEMRYRPDIDGLRAVAVLSVVIFHAGLGMPGGFVGVDVFFVISGFLITGIIRSEIDARNGAFSFSGFWMRRIRRILPPALLVMASTLVVGAFVLLPEDLVGAASAALAQLAFAGNFYFWSSTNYFSGPAELKPLLHFWSLAVEEQYYLLYPVALLILLRVGRSITIYALLGGLLVSLLLGIAFTESRPAASFYLLPFRAWELAAGALVALLPAIKLTRQLANMVAAVGGGAIAVAVTLFDKTTAFRGGAAALPVFGTAAVILANRQRNGILYLILAWRPLVAIGLISYSLYLWHWPVLAYARYITGELTPIVAWPALALSFLLSALTWKFVENPCRNRRLTSNTAIGLGVGVGILFVAVVSIVAVLANGLPDRFPERIKAVLSEPGFHENPEFRAVKLSEDDWSLPNIGASTDSAGSRLIVWGDSHAGALAPAFQRAGKELGLRIDLAARGGVPPLPGLATGVARSEKGWSDVNGWTEFVIRHIESQDIRHVILVAAWDAHAIGWSNLDTPDHQARTSTPVRLISESVARLSERLGDGRCLYLVEQVPYQTEQAPLVVAREVIRRGDVDVRGVTIEQDESFRRRSGARKALEAMENEIHLKNINGDFLRPDGFTKIAVNGIPVYKDAGHVSRFGASEIAYPQVLELLQPLVPSSLPVSLGGIHADGEGHGFGADQYKQGECL